MLIPDVPLPPGVRAAVTTRDLAGFSRAPFGRFNLGAHCGDAPEAVAANRERLMELLELPGRPLWLRQVHGTGVVDAEALPADAEPEADAAITREPGRVLAVLTADCLPVIFAACDGSVIGVAHAGWRGLAAGVLEATLSRMAVDPVQVIAWLGPSIGAASYEVGSEVRDAFLACVPSAADAFTATRPGHWRCDLPAIARRRLHMAGLRRVDGGSFDTCADPRFHSYRRDRHTGRFATLVWRP